MSSSRNQWCYKNSSSNFHSVIEEVNEESIITQFTIPVCMIFSLVCVEETKDVILNFSHGYTSSPCSNCHWNSHKEPFVSFLGWNIIFLFKNLLPHNISCVESCKDFFSRPENYEAKCNKTHQSLEITYHHFTWSCGILIVVFESTSCLLGSLNWFVKEISIWNWWEYNCWYCSYISHHGRSKISYPSILCSHVNNIKHSCKGEDIIYVTKWYLGH